MRASILGRASPGLFLLAPLLLASPLLTLNGCAGPEGGAHGAASLVRMGDAMRDGGDPPGALSFYRSALLRDPRDVQALSHMGALLNRGGAFGEAEQAFRAALVVEPARKEAQRGLAVSLLAQERPEEALIILRELARGTEDPQVLRDYGVALDLSGDGAAAQEAYRAGLRRAPANAVLHGNLALSLAAGGQDAAALAEARAAASSPLPDPRVTSNAVLVAALAGREGEAREFGAGLEPTRLAALLTRAAAARAIPPGRARARALGLDAGP